MEKALGIKYGSCKDYELVKGVDYIPLTNFEREDHWNWKGGLRTDDMAGYMKKYRENNPEWHKAEMEKKNARRRTAEGRERGKKAQAAWREKNREVYNEYMREYRKKNAEKVNANARAYRDKDRDAYNKHMREYRARKRAA